MVKKVSEILVFRKPKVSDQLVINKKVEELSERESIDPEDVGVITSQHIQDGTIQEEDLAPDAKAGLHELENEENFASNDMVASLFG